MALTLTQPKINFENYGHMWLVALMSVCKGEWGGEEYNNFSNISWVITSKYGWLFTEQYTYVTSTKGWFIMCGDFKIANYGWY